MFGRPAGDTLFPYTTRFRSGRLEHEAVIDELAGAQRGEPDPVRGLADRSEEHTSELQSRRDLVCRLMLVEKIYAMALSQAEMSINPIAYYVHIEHVTTNMPI